MNVTKLKMKKLTQSLLLAGVIGAVALPATAKKYRDYSAHSNASYDYAKVVEVNPLVETYQVNNPIEKCWDERRPVHNSHYSDRSYSNSKRPTSRTPEIFGAIIGAAVANQIGKRGGGKARDVATVAGAVLGGSIGRDIKHKNQHSRDRYEGDRHSRYEPTRYETVQQCELQDNYTTQQQVVAYDVAYKYRGKVFYTEMDQHPGNKIRVKVTVDPV